MKGSREAGGIAGEMHAGNIQQRKDVEAHKASSAKQWI